MMDRYVRPGVDRHGAGTNNPVAPPKIKPKMGQTFPKLPHSIRQVEVRLKSLFGFVYFRTDSKEALSSCQANFDRVGHIVFVYIRRSMITTETNLIDLDGHSSGNRSEVGMSEYRSFDNVKEDPNSSYLSLFDYL